MAEYYPGLSPNSSECMDKLGVALAHCESKCKNFYDAAEVERVFYPEMEKLLLEFFPGATIIRATSRRIRTTRIRESTPSTPISCTTT